MTFTRIDVLRWSDSFSEGVHTKETTPQGPLWAETVDLVLCPGNPRATGA